MAETEKFHDPFALARDNAVKFGIERKEGEDDVDFRGRVARELRERGHLQESSEAYDGVRWATVPVIKNYWFYPREPDAKDTLEFRRQIKHWLETEN